MIHKKKRDPKAPFYPVRYDSNLEVVADTCTPGVILAAFSSFRGGVGVGVSPATIDTDLLVEEVGCAQCEIVNILSIAIGAELAIVTGEKRVAELVAEVYEVELTFTS